MFKKLFFSSSMVFLSLAVFSQDMKNFKLYKPEENATEGIAKAVKDAKAAGKNVLIQVGGNWCIWCARFYDYVNTEKSLDSTVKANYVVYHLNYSKENTNPTILANYSFPQRFGFPVFLILDSDGKLLHTQNSSYLEKDKGYDKEKVMGFFNDWGPKAFDPAQYKEQ